jgi:hypothetical protein
MNAQLAPIPTIHAPANVCSICQGRGRQAPNGVRFCGCGEHTCQTEVRRTPVTITYDGSTLDDVFVVSAYIGKVQVFNMHCESLFTADEVTEWLIAELFEVVA